MNGKLAWDVARAGGIVAWALLSCSVIWGLLLSSRLLGGRPPAAWLLDLHRYLGALSLVFTGVHVGGLVADNYLHIGWAEVFVPQASAWRPLAVTWGVLALYLLMAIEATSLAQRFLPRRLWRQVHMAAFPLVLFTSLHGAQAGSDAGHRGYRVLSVTVLAIIVGLMVLRLAIGRRAHQRRRGGGPGERNRVVARPAGSMVNATRPGSRR